MSNREIGLALMDTLPLRWTASGVAVDPNMADLMDRDSVGYVTARAAWVGESYEYDAMRHIARTVEWGPQLPFFASEGVLAQVAMRDSILAEMDLYNTVRRSGSTGGEGIDGLRESLERRQAAYNQQYVTSGMMFTPENFVSQQFRNELHRYPLRDRVTHISYVHSGIDTVGPNTAVISPGFLRAADVPEVHQRDNDTVLGLVGSDVHFRLLHMDPDQMVAIAAGKMYTPGQVIGNYGEWHGVDSHLHLEATRLSEQAVRGFVNPLTVGGTWYPWDDFAGYYETFMDGVWTRLDDRDFRGVFPR